MTQPQPVPGEEELEAALEENLDIALGAEVRTIDELVAARDAEGLIELGAAYRAGAGVERDLFTALECFEAASSLGSADAELLVGLAYFNGVGIGQDTAEGAKRIRSAAQRGSLRAKVYVANLYEMGVHYAYDREKADVWYRNVARSASLSGGPDDDTYVLGMAELGALRFCLQLVADEGLPVEDRAFYLKKAKSMGYRHRLAAAKTPAPVEEAPTDASPGEAPLSSSASESAPEARAEAAAPAPRPDPPPQPEPPAEALPRLLPIGSTWTLGRGLVAFLVALAFAAAATGVGVVAQEGAEHLPRLLAALQGHPEVLLYATAGFLGLLPAAAVYRAQVVLASAVLGTLAGLGGFYLQHSGGQALLGTTAPVQGVAFAFAVALVLQLVLGLLGGTRFRVLAPTDRAASRPRR
jgi:hypothetical protein